MKYYLAQMILLLRAIYRWGNGTVLATCPFCPSTALEGLSTLTS